MSIQHVLTSETGLTVIGALVGGIWTALRSSEWYRQLSERRHRRALDALEAGVELTYRTYVKAIKDSRADGKLTEDEATEARRRAREAAIEFGRSQGVDVVRALGAELVDLWTAKLVRRLKRV